MKSSVFALAVVLAVGRPAVAAPCDDIARLAEASGGGWPQVGRLPQKEADDGPWYYEGARYDNAPNKFHPHLQADRLRLLGEAKAVAPGELDLISSYLSPTPQAFDKTAENEEIDYLNVHRWPGAPFFAIAAHDSAVTCETDWAFFYTGADGRIHVANSPGLNTCDSPASGVWPGMALIHVGPDWAFMDEMRSDDAVEDESDLTQEIALWTGTAFAPACTLTYYHHVSYKLSDQTRFEDSHFHARPPTVEDRWLLRNALALVPDYLKQRQVLRAIGRLNLKYDEEKVRLSQAQVALFNAHAGINLLKAAQLKSAYDALRDHLQTGEILVPVTVGKDDYFVGFNQEYSGKGPAMPYTDVTLYAVAPKAERRASIVLEVEQGRLYKVDAALAKPPAQ